jgi:hypothetical protein
MGDVSDRNGCKDAKPLVAGRYATLSSAEITCGREVMGACIPCWSIWWPRGGKTLETDVWRAALVSGGFVLCHHVAGDTSALADLDAVGLRPTAHGGCVVRARR